MTESAQLRTRPAARREVIVPREARSVRPAAALTRTHPVPPAFVPVVPSMPGRHVVGPAQWTVSAPGVVEAAPRRSRCVMSLVATAAVTLAVIVGMGWVGRSTNPGFPAETAVVRVGAGETEWDVARRVAPQYDQRAVVERIRQLNGIEVFDVQPGQQLQVPDGRQ
jgi:LysM domain